MNEQLYAMLHEILSGHILMEMGWEVRDCMDDLFLQKVEHLCPDCRGTGHTYGWNDGTTHADPCRHSSAPTINDLLNWGEKCAQLLAPNESIVGVLAATASGARTLKVIDRTEVKL